MDDAPFDPITEAQRQWAAHGWADAAAGMALVTSITRVQQLLQNRIDGLLKPFDLTFARYEVLMLLEFSRTGALPMGAIGRRLQVHPTSVTSVIDRLERQGFVMREEHPTDRRAKLARLTPAGRTAALAATDVLNEEVFAAPGVDTTDGDTLFDLLTALRRHLGAQRTLQTGR